MLLKMFKMEKNNSDAKYLFHDDYILSSIQEASPFQDVF